jgi:predicted RNA-binding Zn-ribbon protein involved in translation (DUF1610 family)
LLIGNLGIENTEGKMKKMMTNKLECKYIEYIVNLLTAEDNGSFACPKCGMTISPEDETEKNYSIVNTKVVNNELVELVVTCSKCGITIVITGFQQIEEFLNNRD